MTESDAESVKILAETRWHTQICKWVVFIKDMVTKVWVEVREPGKDSEADSI